MRRRTYGEEIASEPSQFLNELPLELIDDLSRGPSWLSFARGSKAQESKYAVAALRGETVREKPKNLYTGKTYDSKDAIAEFFKNKGISPQIRRDGEQNSERPISGFDKLRSIASEKVRIPQSELDDAAPIAAGSHVRHGKYGKGLVLRREGSGDNVKLTVSFPGFGQKKLIEKFANLEKA